MTIILPKIRIYPNSNLRTNRSITKHLPHSFSFFFAITSFHKSWGIRDIIFRFLTKGSRPRSKIMPKAGGETPPPPWAWFLTSFEVFSQTRISQLSCLGLGLRLVVFLGHVWSREGVFPISCQSPLVYYKILILLIFYLFFRPLYRNTFITFFNNWRQFPVKRRSLPETVMTGSS